MTDMLTVRQAYDGEPIAELPLMDWSEVEPLLERAAALHGDRRSWPPAHERIAILRRLAARMTAERDDLAMLIAREGGKPLRDARVETDRAINGVELAVEEIGRLSGTEIPMDLTAAGAGRIAWTRRQPIGPVVVISAFNHPLNLIVHQAAPAIATGCPVLVKPADPTPLSAKRFVELAHEAGLPPDWCRLVICDIPTAERLVTDPRVAFLSFIGSAKVGWMLRSKLAPGTRCALEHGGAAPVIVDETADLARTVPALVKGGYYHAGQVCVSVQRIFVAEPVREAFTEAYLAEVDTLVTGDPAQPETDVGPLIRPGEVDRVETWVNEAAESGAGLLAGGSRLSERVYRPTVLADPPPGARVSTLEIFGPVTCIYGFEDPQAAIRQANALPYAFQAAVFSRDIDRAHGFADALDASAVMINDHSAFRVDWMPFAGWRESGYGVGGIGYTMHDMTVEKMTVIKHTDPFA